MGSTFNQDDRDYERLKNTSMPELMVQKCTTSSFEFLWTASNHMYLAWMRFTGLPLITFSDRLMIITMITGQVGWGN